MMRISTTKCILMTRIVDASNLAPPSSRAAPLRTARVADDFAREKHAREPRIASHRASMAAPDRGPKLPPDARGGKGDASGKKHKSSKSGGGVKTKKRTSSSDGAMKPLVLLAAGMALVPVIKKLKDLLESRGGGEKGEKSEKGSAFSFGKGKRGGKAKGKGGGGGGDAGIKKPPGAGAKGVERVGNVPRNKASNNKKNRARKAERKASRAEEEDRANPKHKAGQLPNGGHAVVKEGNNVPKDDDIIGGEAGKTFTTTSSVKVPTWYARVREERGND